MSLPGFNAINEKDPIDLTVMGMTIVKHILHLDSRPEKKDFIEEVKRCFYEAPATKFNDELLKFKRNITGSSTLYNDALLFVMAITSDLIKPKAYFDKLLTEYKTVINNMPEKELLALTITSDNWFDCVFFSIRFYIDQQTLFFGGEPAEKEPESE